MTASLTAAQADKVAPLHQENTDNVHAAMVEIMQLAQEQIQVLEGSSMHLRDADGTTLVECIVRLADATRTHEKQVMPC